jgi:type IV secretory pathway VirJ component
MLSLFLATVIATSKLPLVEVPATKGSSDTLVVFVSGDGGWAKIDKSISKILAENGMPVIGLNALQYFWTKRTPDAAARDLQSIVEKYLTTWKKERVLFVGYSRGADVLPFMINRLPAELRSKTRLIALLGPSPKVEFEFHIGDWMRSSSRNGFAVKPEVDRLSSHNIVCLFGEDDKDSLCPAVSGPRIQKVMLRGAHHFDGSYEKLAAIILLNLK